MTVNQIAAAGQMLNPSALDWAVELGAPAIAVLLLVSSLLHSRRARRDRER